MTSPSVAYILCGGASKRMQRDKATTLFQGKPLVAWIMETCHQANLSPILVHKKNSAPALYDLCEHHILDNAENFHPLYGIIASMEDAIQKTQPSILVLPCDTPFLSLQSLISLQQSTAPSVGVSTDSLDNSIHTHPLIAHYSIHTLDRARELATQEAPVREFAKLANWVYLSEKEVYNCNYPSDVLAHQPT